MYVSNLNKSRQSTVERGKGMKKKGWKKMKVRQMVRNFTIWRSSEAFYFV